MSRDEEIRLLLALESISVSLAYIVQQLRKEFDDEDRLESTD